MKKKIILSLVILFLISIIYIGIDFYTKIFVKHKDFITSITIDVRKGMSVSSIADLLKKNKLIKNSLYFKIYYKLFRNKKSLRSGEYYFDKTISAKEILDILIKGKVKLYSITIPEGLTIEETARLLERYRGVNFRDFMKDSKNISLIYDLDKSADDLEGYLYPDTYFLEKNTKAKEIIAIMVNRFKKKYSNQFLHRTKELGMSVREIVTLASLIEKETSSREERFLISSVFHNRLRIGMPLGCDPTIIYALKRDGIYKGKLGWKELRYDSPYNTRIYKGLPPGPICSPGIDSIEAALYPENTGYIYFVAKDSKSHYFSKTLKEHNQAVRKYILNK